MGVDWSNLQKELVASCSWDGTIKIVSSSSRCKPRREQTLINLAVDTRANDLDGHDPCTYDDLSRLFSFTAHLFKSFFNPCRLFLRVPDPLLAPRPQHARFGRSRRPLPHLGSAHGCIEGSFARLQSSSGRGAQFRLEQVSARGQLSPPDYISSSAASHSVLQVIAVGGTDKPISVYDLRSVRPPAAGPAEAQIQPIALLEGHTLPIRRVAWSPHKANVLASGGYDMTCKV